MAISLNKVGINLNRSERLLVNENWTTIENELEKAKGGSELAELAKLAADDAQAKADSIRQELNEVVVSGDSGPQAAQASVGADGTSYDGNLKARLDAEHNKVIGQLAETAKTTISKFTHKDVTIAEFRSSKFETTYWITTIPYMGVDGHVYKPQVGYTYETLQSGLGKPSDFAKKEKTLLTINGGTYSFNHNKTGGMFIKDGVVLEEWGDYLDGWETYILGIKANNTLKTYPYGTHSNTLLAEGVVNAVTGFVPMIENGEIQPESVLEKCVHWNQVHPRQVICQMPNKDILILTCDGRKPTERGMTLPEITEIVKPLGVIFAYNLDGGGSSSTIIKNKKMNADVDGSGERSVPNFIYFKEYEEEESEDQFPEFTVTNIDKAVETNGQKGLLKVNSIKGKSVVEGTSIKSVGTENSGVKIRVTKGEVTKDILFTTTTLRSTGAISDEWTDNKLIKRCGQQVLNGSEPWLWDGTVVNTTHDHFYIPHSASKSNSSLFSTFPSITAAEYQQGTKEGLCKFTNTMGMSIAKSRITFTRTQEFIDWIGANNIPIIYELSAPSESIVMNNPIIISHGDNVRLLETVVIPEMLMKFDTSIEARVEYLEYLLA